ncbi:septal ring lytic transglycosylase RlpA family protein [Vibrio penaeicida]|uniref:Endolytic peptidoglycan transglycosylase RlpA n=1 Tax=Vibrio penaeicida TaxID=104609 RepID=A0AAV5NX18_9VIBR|nr:septal ring lytic transglycosylase RlpA family protein [Vibrio penaeicida]RTZ24825.1 septal ring lytic transglycosylase RlpA family protein [Vibrio penaeicida]GLQ74975.1 endolytic peptidoglycan transglycosylase RlpA [Vibrio penaeicida]
MAFRIYSLIVILILALTGCTSPDKGRYTIDDDVAPEVPLSVEHIEDAHPVYEPISLGGNKDYSLLGGSYKIVKEPEGFTQEGKASWYGKKFHGHLTSNGEIYDMYSMSAAHKTLPLPSYVKVLNKDNGKAAIVRINDRGPFHEGRIIDLSYAAAYKLGVVQTGTANVKIEYISVSRENTSLVAQKKLPRFVIQVAASKDEDKARTLAKSLGQSLSVRSYTEGSKKIHRIFLGPFNDQELTQKTLSQVHSQGYPTAFIKQVKQNP